ncbi:hypothetical protein DYB32_004995 [Aphanomyces invadans]|nr:hypothetical protein DYB32_004995 [Aphanomyces invadans]
MRAVTHQVHSMPRTQNNNLATVCVVLEAAYKAALLSGALKNPKSLNNDDRGLNVEVRPGKYNCKRKGH